MIYSETLNCHQVLLYLASLLASFFLWFVCRVLWEPALEEEEQENSSRAQEHRRLHHHRHYQCSLTDLKKPHRVPPLCPLTPALPWRLPVAAAVDPVRTEIATAAKNAGRLSSPPPSCKDTHTLTPASGLTIAQSATRAFRKAQIWRPTSWKLILRQLGTSSRPKSALARLDPPTQGWLLLLPLVFYKRVFSKLRNLRCYSNSKTPKMKINMNDNLLTNDTRIRYQPVSINLLNLLLLVHKLS